MSDEKYWYKDAIIYELRIRSFYDSDGDGIGDFRGLTERLDYLQDLGVTTLWLLPFYPSPLKDDGYDIADYLSVHPSLGTLRDFKAFLKEAHRRGLRVLTELVLNHTSDQHPWFQRARRAPAGSRWRNFYVWTDDPSRYAEARIIFKDFETSNWSWDPVAQAYFWHRFYAHQPDLNFENPEVQKAILDAVDCWFDMGVDGLRLDAVPYLYERDGTNCENLQETHAFLKRLRAHVDKKFQNRMLLAEANQWPEDAVAYFGEGDECHMAFHFPIMPRLFMALRMEDNFPILDILEQTPHIPDNCQWAIFLRNHDELTLEMVTDEERDYMVDSYAADRQARINLGIRRRLAPLLENNRRRVELMNALLFALPGTPVVYYGDEIGMGDNVYLGDRDGVRTPMQWTPDRNAGFSRANPQRLVLPAIVDPEYHYEAVNVETQQANPSSLLWWMKRIIALRKQFRAFGRGTFEPLSPSNRKVLAFLRRYGDEVLLVVANLSRFAQYAELDLSEFRGMHPVELFGNLEFPKIGEQPYLMMLGAHNFFWFSLTRVKGEAELAREESALPSVEVQGSWDVLLRSRARAPFERALTRYIQARRWFRGKSRTIKGLRVVDCLALVGRKGPQLAFVELSYVRGEPEIYVLPLAFLVGVESHERAIVEVRVRGRGTEAQGLVVDASDDPAVSRALLDIAVNKRIVRAKTLALRGVPVGKVRDLKGETELPPGRMLAAEQTNSSYLYGDRLVGKLLRKVEAGKSVELEVLEHLQHHQDQVNVPGLMGHIEIDLGSGKLSTLAIFQAFVPNQGDAWQYTIDAVERYFEEVLSLQLDVETPPAPPSDWLSPESAQPSERVRELFEPILGLARLLGQRTAELHAALAEPHGNPDFEPEPFGSLSKRAFYQSLRNLFQRVIDGLKAQQKQLSEGNLELSRQVLKREREIRTRLSHIRDHALTGKRIRVHGDFHLGQVLFTGRDFVIIDFEGEPGRSLAHRRGRRSPLADVAGMMRSFHYAAYGVLSAELGPSVRAEDVPLLEPWARAWYGWISVSYLRSYLEHVEAARLLPEKEAELKILLDAYLLEKSLYEVLYELDNRPNWIAIPLTGVLEVLDSASLLP